MFLCYLLKRIMGKRAFLKERKQVQNKVLKDLGRTRAYLDKRGEAGLLETIIFLILNIIFFLTLGYFAYNSGTQSFIYEQAYAKQLALLIDNAKPDMVIMINLDELIPIALKKNKNINEVFYVDEKINEVRVNLNPSGGYRYRYFSDNSVKFEIKDNYLFVTITKRGVENENL